MLAAEERNQAAKLIFTIIRRRTQVYFQGPKMAGFLRAGPHFDPDHDIPDLEGQVYIVTGASTGIGFGIVAHLLRHNAAKIITLSSRQQNGLRAIEDLKAHGDTSRVTWLRCNLKDLVETDMLARKLLAEETRIDGLVLNAGIGVGKYGESNDKIDSHFQINALAQFHLAMVLLPTLQATGVLTNTPSRLVMMASEMHRFAPPCTRFETVEEINTDVGSIRLYSRSKLAQILLIREIARRLDEGELATQVINSGGRTVLVNATHPGGVKTPQQDQTATDFGMLAQLVIKVIQPFLVDPLSVGCRTGLFASTPNTDLLEGGGIHGQYIVPEKKVEEPSRAGRDRETGERLWKLTIEILQDKLGSLDYKFKTLP